MVKQINFKKIGDLEEYTTSQLRKIANYYLRKYLLQNSERNGKGEIFCPLKKKWYHEKDMEVSHYISRRCKHLELELDNVILSAKDSNTWDNLIFLTEFGVSQHIKDYTDYIGNDKANKLKELKNKTPIQIMTKDYYINKIKYFMET
jgi:hypothetical protein